MSDPQKPYHSRRDALKCLGWAGAGVIWSVVGGVPRGALIGSAEAASMPAGAFSFAQISDTHFGFAKDANPDTTATARAAIAAINAMPTRPALVLHTGDITHLSKPAEFDLAHQIFSELKVGDLHFTPGEHDALDETPGTLYRQGFAKDSKGAGWYSFDQNGVHFVCLVNVFDLTAGMAKLGDEQIEWLEDDLAHLKDSTPIVIFTHIPLWTVHAPWGWGTVDADKALSYVKRFGSVTVLNGHIHQVMQKVEGNISFYTARATAYPQPKPGDAPSPGPLKVPAEQLRQMLGVRSIAVMPGTGPLAVADQTLANG